MNAATSRPSGVLFLARSLNYGGCERQLVILATGLVERGVNLTVATFYPGGPLSKELDSAGVPLVSIGKSSRWEFVGFFWRLVQLFRRLRPAILHSYLPTANILAALLKPFCPSTRIVWGLRASRLQLGHYGWMNRIQLWFESKLSGLPDLIIVNSKSGFDDAVRRGFPQNRMIVIPNGIDVNRFSPDPDAGSRIRQEWGIENHERLIGLIGRLDPMKGHDTFIKAAAQFSREQKDVRFVCVGDGTEIYRRMMTRLCDELGLGHRIFWVKASDHMHAIYNAIDLLTSCSSYGEGFSNVIAEAMACGVPCVVSDVGDSASIVGNTGKVVQPENPQELADAWRLLLDRLRLEPDLGLRARARIIQYFRVDSLVERTLAALGIQQLENAAT